jgi:hypothetical protein
VSTDYFYLGSGYSPFRVIKYTTAEAKRQQHTEFQSNLITSINALALTADASTLYALMNTTTKNYFAISKIETRTMDSVSYVLTTLPISQVDQIFVVGQYLSMIGNNMLLRYSLDCVFIDSTPLSAVPFEMIDATNGILYLQGSAGIDRLDINTLRMLSTIPVDWKSVGAVTKDSLTKINNMYYIVNNGIEDPTAVSRWKLHTISSNAISSNVLGTWRGTQPQLLLDAVTKEIVVVGSASNTENSFNAVLCIINPTQITLDCHQTVFGSTSRSTIFVSVSNQYVMLSDMLIQIKQSTQDEKLIRYSPTTYRSRDNLGMAVLGDQVFFCSSERTFPGLVAMNVVTGTVRTVALSCDQITIYGNKIYVNSHSDTMYESIVSIDASTLQMTTVDPEPVSSKYRERNCWRSCVHSQIFTMPGVGLFYTSYPNATDTESIHYNKINEDGTVQKIDCASQATPKGICSNDKHILARDEEYMYAIPDFPIGPPIRKMYRYKVGSDTPIYYESDPAELCNYKQFSFILDPRNTHGNRYGYLACGNVYKFDLLTGVVTETFLKDENFAATRMVFRGDDLWISGASSNAFKIFANAEMAPVNWKVDAISETTPTAPTPAAIPVTPTSTATKSVIAMALFIAMLSLSM